MMAKRPTDQITYKVLSKYVRVFLNSRYVGDIKYFEKPEPGWAYVPKAGLKHRGELLDSIPAVKASLEGMD